MPLPLEATEELWRRTLESSPFGISLIDLDGTWVRVNRALCEMLGYAESELLGGRFQDITHPEDLEEDLVQLRQLHDGVISGYRMRKRFCHKLGHEVHVDLSVAMVCDDDGNPTHFVGHSFDLTEELQVADRMAALNAQLTRQAARLEASNRDLEAFAMLVSHDLQAPLATVSGYLQLLAEEYADQLDGQAKGWIRRSEAAATRMSELVTSLLSMSRAGSELRRVPVSIEELVVEVCADLEPVMREHEATVEVAEEDLMIVGDPARLRQVLQNLVHNAIKYRHPERDPHVSVNVDGTREPGFWTVTVDDTSQRIPEDRREAVFTMFTRAADQQDSSEAGHGIGLAACRRIVERHGGRIWVEPHPDGPGNRFAFTLAR